MKNLKKYFATIALSLVCMLSLSTIASAATPIGFAYATELGLGTRDLRAGIMSFINIIMGLLGTIAILIILYGGFKWMTSGGSDDKVGEARKLIIEGAIGLVVILSAYAIAQFVLDTAISATT
jgi:hypothetical protein